MLRQLPDLARYIQTGTTQAELEKLARTESDTIGQWRSEMTRLQQLQTGQLDKLPAAPPSFLERYPGWEKGWRDLRELKGAGKESDVEALAKTWADRLAYKLREKQGQALFFASEAYQDEGTILHVVQDLQESKRGKLISLAKLSGGGGITCFEGALENRRHKPWSAEFDDGEPGESKKRAGSC